MSQTVFNPGEPITSRLTLGISPDGTTNVTATVTKPDGTTLSGVLISGWTGDVKTLQFYATDDGTAGGTTLNVAGDWLVTWKVTGTGAAVLPKVYGVQPLPTPGAAADYAPFLHEVADYVPWLTLSQAIPGADTFLGTFTGDTWPTDEQVHRMIRRYTMVLTGRWPDLADSVAPLARVWVALRVAADLARAYPRQSSDLADADALASQAADLWAQLVEMADDTSVSPAGAAQAPTWAFPAPVAWGDMYL